MYTIYYKINIYNIIYIKTTYKFNFRIFFIISFIFKYKTIYNIMCNINSNIYKNNSLSFTTKTIKKLRFNIGRNY